MLEAGRKAYEASELVLASECCDAGGMIGTRQNVEPDYIGGITSLAKTRAGGASSSGREAQLK